MLALVDVDPEPLAQWVAVLTPIGVMLVALWRWEKRVGKRLDDAERGRAELQATLNKQFGPNSGGMREKVNGIADGVAEMKDVLNRQVARLDEHIDFHLKKEHD